MSDYRKDRKKNSPPDEDEISIPEEELEKVVSAMMKTLEMGICAVYGQEDPDAPDAVVNCDEYLDKCGAVCCTFQFALTKEEVRSGHITHDTKRPFFIARDKDRYCSHLDRRTLKCRIWNDRPLRCRRYDCSGDPDVWP